MKKSLLLFIFVLAAFISFSQNLSYTCPRDTVLGCNATCLTLKARFPDIRALGTNYTLDNATKVSVCRPYDPPEVIGPATNVTIDDTYSNPISLGFSFPFYGTVYNSVVVSTNGYLSFDVSLAGGFSDWTLTGNVPSTSYDKGLVMGPWHDLDPTSTIGTSPTQQIKYNILGTAPNRKWVLSFYKVPLFSATCNDLIENTHQIVLHETSGVIEVFIFDKQQCPTWNGGKAMVGLQDMTQTKGIVPPGRGAADPPWGTVGMNEVWRFIPTGGAPLYRSVQLLNAAGAVVATGDTTRVNINTFETSFPNVCPPSGASFYVVKTTYQQLNNASATYFSLDTINIIRQAQLPVTATTTATACGLSTGTITAAAAGTAPYQFSIDGGTLQAAALFSTVSQGPHTVYAIDATGCNNTITVNVTSISSLTNTFVKTNTSCPGLTNGSITVTPTAGTAPYTYSINGGTTTQPSNVFLNLAPGSYTVSFTDVNGCTGTTTSITVAAGTGITATLSNNTGTSCSGINDGSVTVTPTSGTGPYTYSVDGGPAQASNIITGLSSGSHTITIKDASGCTGTKNVFTSSGSGLAGNYTATSTSCPGVNNAVVTVTPTNGVAPYTYSIDGGAFLPGPITGVSASIHTVTIKDANGCTGQITIIVTAGSGITATAVPTPSACSGINNGVITITTNGTAPYSYSTDGGLTYTPLVGNTISNLAPGTYTLIIKDANGCRASITTIITAGTNILFTTTSTLASCPGVNNATITVTPSSGSAPYTYSINGGTSFLPLTGSIIPGVGAGVISVIIKDANGCTGTANVTVSAGAGITGSYTAVATSCPGVSTGTITVTATSGDAPYSYGIDGGTFQVSNVFSGLSSGAHTIIIKDANGCTGNLNTTVGPGIGITGTALAVATSCPGVNNGSVTINPATGTAPYTYSIDGGALQANNIFTGLASGPHVGTFQDANGCAGTVNINVPVGAGITGTTSFVATTCPGVSNGSITVSPTSGTTPYTYTIDGGVSQPGNIFNNISAGLHVITFQDANGCVGTKNVTVTSGAVITATATSLPTTCPGVNNGSLTITPTTGAAPYSYIIDGGASQPGNTFNNLASGSHSISFQDANGCIGTKTVVVGSGAVITATSATVATTCPGVNNGSVTITPATGTAPYTYTIDGGASQAGNTFSNLSSGAHVITFQDANGCIGTTDVSIPSGALITASSTSVPTSCPGVNNGSLTVTPITGTAPYTYSLDGGTAQTVGIFNGVAAGPHIVTFQDANGCVATRNVSVPAGAGITGTVSQVPTSCPGVSNGSITITAVTGTAPYTYSLDGGTYQAGNTFNGLASGPHIGNFKDFNGCIGTVNINVGPGTGITGSASAVATGCPGVNNGSITATPATGTGPYAYSLDGGTTQSVNTFTGLAPGLHTIIFTDANGCSATVSATVNTGSGLISTEVVVGTSCPGVNNGMITITPTTGTAPYSYSIDGGSTQNLNIFSNLTAGSHTINFTDALGCTGIKLRTVPAGVNLASTVVPVNPPCANINDGTITLSATTGVSPYLYSINAGITTQSSPTFSNLAPGTYTIAFSDDIGCKGTKTVTLTTHTPVMCTVAFTKPLCNSNANGIITITGSGGVSPYKYSKDLGVNYQTSGIFSGLAAGSHTFLVKDNVGCIKDTTVTLTEPTLLTANATSPAPETCAGNDGRITITPAGGTPGYQYSIDNGVNYQAANSFYVPQGNYPNIVVKDSKGCKAFTDTIVRRVDNMFLTLGPDTSVCLGASVKFQPQTNTGTNIFQWTAANVSLSIPAGTIDNDTLKNATVTPADTFSYTLTAHWGICTRKDTINIFVKHKPVAFAGENQSICVNDSTAVLTGGASNVSGAVNYAWTPADGLETPFASTTVAILHTTKPYTLTVSDAYGCNFSATDEVLISLQPPVPAFAGNDTIAIPNVPHQLMASGGVSYEWSPASALNFSTIQFPLATLTHDQQFVVSVTDVAGCVGTDTVFVKVYPGPAYHVPNAFTPNGDGLNDVFRVIPAGIAYTEWFRIFNRYGELVFETNKWLQGWDGTYLGRKQPGGNYVWTLKGVDKNGKAIELKGTVLLVR